MKLHDFLMDPRGPLVLFAVAFVLFVVALIGKAFS